MQLSGRTGPSDYATNGASTRNPAPNRTNFAPRWGIARVRSVGISQDGSNATGTANFPLIEHETSPCPRMVSVIVRHGYLLFALRGVSRLGSGGNNPLTLRSSYCLETVSLSQGRGPSVIPARAMPKFSWIHAKRSLLSNRSRQGEIGGGACFHPVTRGRRGGLPSLFAKRDARSLVMVGRPSTCRVGNP